MKKTSFAPASVAAFILLLSGCGYNVKVIREQGQGKRIWTINLNRALKSAMER